MGWKQFSFEANPSHHLQLAPFPFLSLPIHLTLRTAVYLTPCLFILFIGFDCQDWWGFPQGGGTNPGWEDPPLLTLNHEMGGLSQEGAALGSAMAMVSLSPSSENSRSRGCSHGPYNRLVISCSTLQTKNLAIQLPVSWSLESLRLVTSFKWMIF